MAGGGGGGRSLDVTPTWAVAVVCFALVAVSIIIEYLIHLLGTWLKKNHKRDLYEALEKIKAELMLLGFMSLLLIVVQGPISKICIPRSVGASWHPCRVEEEDDETEDENTCGEGKVQFVSEDALHQLHRFIFVLALSHVVYCITTLALGRLKMRKWKAWEDETKTIEYQYYNDPERFRFARETSFGRRHLSFWSKSPILLWIAHLAPQSQVVFDFQKYISRSLEEDFAVVVGISPILWLFSMVFIVSNTHEWYSHFWLPFIPLIALLLVGAKLQVIITKMGLRIQARGEVVKGTPVVEPGDDLFWFNRPRLILFLIHFVLFQNAFQLAFFVWSWYEFGLRSCFHETKEDIAIRLSMGCLDCSCFALQNAFQLAFFVWSWYEFGLRSCFHETKEDIAIRLSMGVIIQFVCSYVTLPLYALVTQMGSTMKPTIFSEQVATGLKNWRHNAKIHAKSGQLSENTTPLSSRTASPLHGMSPFPLLQNYQNNAVDSLDISARTSGFENEGGGAEESPSPSNHDIESSTRNAYNDQQEIEIHEPISTQQAQATWSSHTRHETEISLTDFSFINKE
ncbi:unnamed protein product [Ilex paraguariensis]|uniref:MLO-like protein n=1 Tax=Ilex paraguariensis TaxID=185542 RepID=A0ABC8QV55_9AQUA